MEERYKLKLVSVYISFIGKNVEHFRKHLLASYMSSLRKNFLLCSTIHLNCTVLFLGIFFTSLNSLAINPLLDA